MVPVQEEALDEKLYATFRNKLQRTKDDTFYLREHFNRYTKISRRIKYIFAGGAALATGAWMIWWESTAVRIVCSVVILILQVASAISEHFPYESRKLELRDMLTELEQLYAEMENDWRSICSSRMPNSKIQEAIYQYDKKQIDIKRHYFKDDALPENGKLKTKANKKTEEYFKNLM